MSDENNVRYPEDDPMMPEPLRYIFQMIRRQEERSAAFAGDVQHRVSAAFAERRTPVWKGR